MILFRIEDRNFLDWQNEVGFDSWNWYKGDLDVLKSTGNYTQTAGSNETAASDCGLTQSWMQDFDELPAGKAAFFLVSGTNAAGESDLGFANPCP